MKYTLNEAQRVTLTRRGLQKHGINDVPVQKYVFEMTAMTVTAWLK